MCGVLQAPPRKICLYKDTQQETHHTTGWTEQHERLFIRSETSVSDQYPALVLTNVSSTPQRLQPLCLLFADTEPQEQSQGIEEFVNE